MEKQFQANQPTHSERTFLSGLSVRTLFLISGLLVMAVGGALYLYGPIPTKVQAVRLEIVDGKPTPVETFEYVELVYPYRFLSEVAWFYGGVLAGVSLLVRSPWVQRLKGRWGIGFLLGFGVQVILYLQPYGWLHSMTVFAERFLIFNGLEFFVPILLPAAVTIIYSFWCRDWRWSALFGFLSWSSFWLIFTPFVWLSSGVFPPPEIAVWILGLGLVYAGVGFATTRAHALIRRRIASRPSKGTLETSSRQRDD